MGDVTRLLLAMERGDSDAVAELFPIIYQELREMAARKLAHEPRGLALRPTELVHEAYSRLVGPGAFPHWEGSRHFYGAASEAMRRILVEFARKKKQARNGGQMGQVELSESLTHVNSSVEELLAVNDLLDQLGSVDHTAAEIVKQVYFVGRTTEEAARVMGLAERSAYRKWRFARTWLYARLRPE